MEAKVIFTILFWTATFVEFYALSTKDYAIYTVARSLLVPIIVIRVMTTALRNKVGLYIYLFLFFSLFGDLATIFGNPTVAYLGLDGFSLASLSLACHFQQADKKDHAAHLMMLLGLFLLGCVNAVFILLPEQNRLLWKIQSLLHAFYLFYLLLAFIQWKGDLPKASRVFYSITVSFIIMASIVYGLDVLTWKRKYTLADAAVGGLHSLYLFFFMAAVIQETKNSKSINFDKTLQSLNSSF